MKLLIVDNEKHVIEAIQMLVEWEAYTFQEVHTALDGNQAIKIIKEEKPEIVLTDMEMPNMHGMKLMEWIHEYDHDIKVIVISGYTDFEYIQHAMRFAGLDYITKPIDKKQLNSALSKAVKIVREAMFIKEREKQFRITKRVSMEKILASMMEDSSYVPKNKKEVMEFLKLENDHTVVLFSIQLDFLDERVMEPFKEDIQLLYYAIRNISEEIASSENIELFVYTSASYGGFVFSLAWGALDRLEHVLSRIHSAICHIYGINVQIGMSNCYKLDHGWPLFFEESLKAIAQRNTLQKDKNVHLYRESMDKKQMHLHLESQEFLLSIKSLNADTIKKLVDKTFDSINRMEYISAGMLERFFGEYGTHRSYWLNKLCIDHDYVVNSFRSSNATLRVRSLEELKTYFYSDLINIMMVYKDLNSKQEDLTEVVKNYIDTHYNAEISLASLSEYFFVSKEHLSRKFKKEVSVNITEYINKIRIKHAKELLNNHQLSVKEIAGEVGFQDEKYFSRVFRKYEKVAPIEYRKK